MRLDIAARTRAVLHWLASPTLATVVMAAWAALLLVWVLPFELYGLPGERIRTLVSSEPFFWVVYVLLIASTAACILPRVARDYRRSRSLPSADRAPSQGSGTLAPVPWRSERAEAALGRAGYRTRVSGDGWVWGVRHRWSPLGTALFHASFFLLLAAALVAASPAWRFSGKTAVSVGERVGPATPIYFEKDGKAAPPAVTFTLVSITPRFYRDILLFTRLDSVLRKQDGSLQGVAVGSPWILGPSDALFVTDFGWTLEAQASSTETAPLPPSIYRLKTFPSGTPDEFKVRASGIEGDRDYRVRVRLYGDFVDRSGKPGSASFNLRNPAALITVTRILSNDAERTVVSDRLVRIPGTVPIGEDTLRLERVGYYGVFRVVRSYSAPLAFLGLILGAAGLVMRLLLPRRQVLLAAHADGVVVSARSDVYGRDERAEARIAEGWDESR
jgi:hypothetical protein